jgi:Cytochrome P460
MIATVAMIAEAAGNLKLPVGYRHWFHVNTMVVDKASPLFAVLGGMHNVHVNSTGEPVLKQGAPYPNGTMFVIDLHDFAVVDGSYVEGPLKGVALMEKDSKKYTSTGGWGFQFWAGGDPKKAVVTDATKQCFGCHQPKRSGLRLLDLHPVTHLVTRTSLALLSRSAVLARKRRETRTAKALADRAARSHD